VCVRAILGT